MVAPAFFGLFPVFSRVKPAPICANLAAPNGEGVMAIPEYSEDEIETVRALVSRRFGHEVPLDIAESALQLRAGSPAVTTCPALFRSERNASFIVVKAGERPFYSMYEQYGTGISEFHDIGECATTFLRVQSDHERGKSMFGVSNKTN